MYQTTDNEGFWFYTVLRSISVKKSSIGIEGDSHLLNGMLDPIDPCFKEWVNNVVQYVAYSAFINSTYMRIMDYISISCCLISRIERWLLSIAIFIFFGGVLVLIVAPVLMFWHFFSLFEVAIHIFVMFWMNHGSIDSMCMKITITWRCMRRKVLLVT